MEEKHVLYGIAALAVIYFVANRGATSAVIAATPGALQGAVQSDLAGAATGLETDAQTALDMALWGTP